MRKFILLLLLTFVFFGGNVFPADTSASPRKDLSGKYEIIYGVNPDKTKYTGILQIINLGETYKLVWKVPQFTIYEGIGILVDNVLCVGWNAGAHCGVVAYKIEGSKLKGKWASSKSGSIGTEDLEGPAGLGGVYKITNAYNPDTGSNYAGTVSINKNGEIYSVNWSLLSESYSGIGILEGDLLIVSWGVGQNTGVVDYKIEDKILIGRWATPGNTGIGIENLSKIY
ncbi:MAG: hypothetical protein WCI77_08915 [Candidatus Omnitrophota bacterium]